LSKSTARIGKRILREWGGLGYKDEVMERIFRGNAERILGR